MMLSESVACALNWGILLTRMDQMDQIKIWMLETVRREKVDEQIGVICLVSMFSTWVMVCKLSKKVPFLQFCADLTKTSKETYIYASESSHYILSENAMIYRSLSHRSWDISD